jgi:dGTP triphosphohydrolase
MADQRSERRHRTDKKDDQRTAFERDRDRVLYSSVFRRLAGITQVVHAVEGHIFRHRLTHTLKVAQTTLKSFTQKVAKRSGLIPPPFSDTPREIKGSDELERARLVAVLIASMTEQQALTLKSAGSRARIRIRSRSRHSMNDVAG